MNAIEEATTIQLIDELARRSKGLVVTFLTEGEKPGTEGYHLIFRGSETISVGLAQRAAAQLLKGSLTDMKWVDDDDDDEEEDDG